MITTITIGLLLLAALVIFIFGVKITESFDYDRNKTVSHKQSIRLWGFIPLVIALFLMGFSMVHIVQARTQGVVVSLGATDPDTRGPGLNFTWPWQDVVAIDTTRQVANYNGGNHDDNPDYHGLVKVQLGNGNYSSVYASVTWQINPDKANLAYSDFRGDQEPVDMVYSRLVMPQFKAALNDVWGTYNPTAQAMALLSQPNAVITPADVDFSPDYTEITTAVKANFEKRMANEDIVQVIDVTVSLVDFDDGTKKQISALQAEVQKTIATRQGIQTAAAQAQANEELAKSLQDPNVLASRCFDLIASGDFTPPIGFSCYPGTSNTTGVIVSPPAK